MLRKSELLVSHLARAAILGGLLMPAVIYLCIGYLGARQMAIEDARIQASRVGYVIAANPEIWFHTTERLADQIGDVRHEATRTQVLDLQGRLLLEIGDGDKGATVSGRAPLMDFGNVVGELRVSVDIFPLLCRGLLAAGLGTVLALFLLWLFNRHVLLPLQQARTANRELSFYDPLTHLPNRRLMLDRLEQAQVSSSRNQHFGALLILDLDNFKTLNDTQGHDTGDRLLIQVAQRLVSTIRQDDTAARLGGDEFVVVLEGLGGDEKTAAQQAEMIGEKIRDVLGQPYRVSSQSQPYHSTPSIGITVFRGRTPSAEILLKQAEVALYQAKAGGRNTLRFYNPEMQAVIDSRSTLEAALRHGLEEGEFQLFYQPQVDGAGKLRGAEALLRWLPAGRQSVPPSEFIAIAEETGLIVPLGLWVLETACVQLRTWAAHPQTRDFQIAVNVSSRQFRQPDFVDQVCACLERTKANPALLKMELTESIVLENVDEVIDRMQQIKTLGVKFSLDDFGTGYSSLSYLKRLPLDQVKIDQSFVRDIGHDPNDAAIVRAIIAMSASLGLEVIAEGVELEEQLRFLRDNGCYHYQGYLFGRPCAIDDWQGFLAERHLPAGLPGGLSLATAPLPSRS